MKKRIEKNLKRRTLRDRKLQMCIWLSEYKSQAQVAELVQEKYDVDITRQAVYEFAHGQKWRKVIFFLRKRFLTDLSKIPIANKAVRLARLEKVYGLALTESLKSINQYGEVYELKLGAAIDAIDRAKEEIEPSHKAAGMVLNNKVVVVNFPGYKDNGHDSDKRVSASRETMEVLK